MRTREVFVKEYNSWLGMKRRCNAVSDVSYKYYGGRGISICTRWNSFVAFLADMGDKPTGTSLDRIDNDGNYEPSNCRWAPHAENCQHRSSSKLTAKDVKIIRRLSLPQKEIASQFGVSRGLVSLIILGKIWKEAQSAN